MYYVNSKFQNLCEYNRRLLFLLTQKSYQWIIVKVFFFIIFILYKGPIQFSLLKFLLLIGFITIEMLTLFSSLSTSYRQLLMSSSLKQQNWRKTEVKTDTAIYCLVSFKLLLLSSFLPSGMPLKLCFTKLKCILQRENKTTMISVVLSVLFSQKF